MRSSVYDRRTTDGWRDRLRRLTGREDEPLREPLFDARGNPTIVVVKGQPLGIRDTKGGVVEFPSDPAEWPDSMWEDVGGDGWFRLRRRDWWR